MQKTQTQLQLQSEVLAAEPKWRSYRRVPRTQIPQYYRSWLLDAGSLTQRLISVSGGNFKVQLLNQGWQRPSLSECKALNISNREHALVREVALVCFGQPWVYARSVIPCSTLSGPQRILGNLGTKPLGAYLFKDPTLKRGPLEVARTRLRSQLKQTDAKTTYGRRSLFYLQQKPLLVAEIFMPEVFATSPVCSNKHTLNTETPLESRSKHQL